MPGGTERAVIIDTRSATAFSQVSIPSALNLAIYSLKTKTYLKDKRLLLIGEPYEVMVLNLESAVESSTEADLPDLFDVF